MIRKWLLYLILFLKDKDYIKSLILVERLNTLTKEQSIRYQNQKLKEIVIHAYDNVVYYRRMFDQLEIDPNSITNIKDLEKLPVLTKKDIVNNYKELTAQNVLGKSSINHTGGSTGQTLKYINSNFDSKLSMALLLNGFKYSGYSIGDHVVVIGGTSLVRGIGFKQKLKLFFTDLTFNFKSFSTTQTNKKTFDRIIKHINRKNSSFLRGYKSSVYLLANYILENDIKLNGSIKAIFTTSEKLLDKQRKIIEKAFDTRVYDQYGLNDGGISAFQDENGNYLIDFERSIIEVVDENNKQIYNEVGRVVGTSLYNYHMPFLRYDSEDLGIKRNNNNGKDFLKEIVGKSNDILSFKDNLNITPILHGILRKHDLNNYQVVKTKDILEVNVSSDKGKDILERLKKEFEEKFDELPVAFNLINESDFYVHANGKHKYVIDLSEE